MTDGAKHSKTQKTASELITELFAKAGEILDEAAKTAEEKINEAARKAEAPKIQLRTIKVNGVQYVREDDLLSFATNPRTTKDGLVRAIRAAKA